MFIISISLAVAVPETAKKTTDTKVSTKTSAAKTYWDKNAPRVYTSCVDSDKAKGSKDVNTAGVVTVTYTKNGKEFKYDSFDFYSAGKKKLYEKTCKAGFKSGQTTSPFKFVKSSCAKGSKTASVVGGRGTWKAGACK